MPKLLKLSEIAQTNLGAPTTGSMQQTGGGGDRGLTGPLPAPFPLCAGLRPVLSLSASHLQMSPGLLGTRMLAQGEGLGTRREGWRRNQGV